MYIGPLGIIKAHDIINTKITFVQGQEKANLIYQIQQ